MAFLEDDETIRIVSARQQLEKKEGSMKKRRAIGSKEEMRKEYDFSRARSNKFAEKYAKGSNIVVIEPDLSKLFPDSETVNAALRSLVSSSARQRKNSSKDQ